MNPSVTPVESPKPPPRRPLPMSDETLLQNVRIASPCSVNWEAMPGGERVRSCAQCNHKVYNLSEMPAADAAQLLRSSEGRVCVRFYRRPDGTVMTQDCPVGRRALRQRAARAATLAFSTLFISLGGLSLATRTRTEQPRFLRWVLNTVRPLPEPQPLPMVMGNIGEVAPIPGIRMGKVAIEPERNYTMGAVAPLPLHGAAKKASSFDDAPFGNSVVPSAAEKPFLEGSEVNNAPRLDPFVKADGAKK